MQKQIAITLFVFLTILGMTSCARKKVAQTIPSVPPPAPTATISAAPPVIAQGQSTTLTWQTGNVSEVTIVGVGIVPPSGTRTVSPKDSTTYGLVAKGPGGTAEANARVTVNAPLASNTRAGDSFASAVRDVYFDYDKYDIRGDQKPITEADAEFLRAHPNVSVVLEGHCDDRGSEEYNLALGDSRAGAMRDALIRVGVSPSQIKTISYGKEHPFCAEESEQCWQQNRRDHIQNASQKMEQR
jgi:peptidoglycan-associated lipoprotein